jgi:hypothetical protein
LQSGINKSGEKIKSHFRKKVSLFEVIAKNAEKGGSPSNAPNPSAAVEVRVARWFIFNPKNPNLGKF